MKIQMLFNTSPIILYQNTLAKTYGISYITIKMMKIEDM